MKWLLIILLLSCNVTKAKRTQQSSSDSTVTRAAATGAVTRSEETETTKGETEKTTTITPILIRDTITNKTYVYPTTVIHERGTTETVINRSATDSVWSALNELARIVKEDKEEVKNKKSVTPWYVWLFGCGLAYLLVRDLIRFIPKRNI